MLANTHHHTVNEETLVLALKDDALRKQAFSQLVSLYQRKIYNIIRKMVISHADADDLVQEVFIKVWNNIQHFKGDSKLFTWIYRIATNECLNFLRKRNRWNMFSMDGNEELTRILVSEVEPDTEEVQLKLQKAILTLPDKQRLVFNLKYFEELSYEEIAAITETSVGSLKASYHHAVKKIEEFFNRH